MKLKTKVIIGLILFLSISIIYKHFTYARLCDQAVLCTQIACTRIHEPCSYDDLYSTDPKINRPKDSCSNEYTIRYSTSADHGPEGSDEKDTHYVCCCKPDEPIEESTCTNNNCDGEEPGSKRCVGDLLEYCDKDGTSCYWKEEKDCKADGSYSTCVKGDTESQAHCLASTAVCGNGITEPPDEECDPDLQENSQGVCTTSDGQLGTCNSECKCIPNPECGNGMIEPGETCDGDAAICPAPPEGDGREKLCTNCQCDFSEPQCGNGIKEGEEECEVISGDTSCTTDGREGICGGDCKCNPLSCTELCTNHGYTGGSSNTPNGCIGTPVGSCCCDNLSCTELCTNNGYTGGSSNTPHGCIGTQVDSCCCLNTTPPADPAGSTTTTTTTYPDTTAPDPSTTTDPGTVPDPTTTPLPCPCGDDTACPIGKRCGTWGLGIADTIYDTLGGSCICVPE